MKDIKVCNGQFETRTPESEGLSSANIREALAQIKDTGLFMQSMHIFKDGYLLAGGCADPISLDGKRRVYSIMKSVTALTIAFELQEGLISLDDPMVKYFPELELPVENEAIKKLTIGQTLAMCVGHKRDAQIEYDGARYGIGALPKHYRDEDPAIFEAAKGKTLKQLFFEIPLEAEPGTEFCYENVVPDIIGMLAENVSGQNYFDYLRPRLFEPLEIDCCSCNLIDEYDGSTRNFSPSTVMSLRDLLKFGLFYLQGGSWNETQLIDREIIRNATSKHIDTAAFAESHKDKGFTMFNNGHGYGHQLWMNKYGGFTLIGGNAQVCCCVPDKNLMVSFTCFDKNASRPENNVLDIIFRNVIDKASDMPLPENPEEYKKMLADFENWSTAPALLSESPLENEFAGKKSELSENDLGIKSMFLSPENSCCSFELEDGSERKIYYGTEGRFVRNDKGLGHTADGYSTIYGADPEEVYASGGWSNEGFVLNLHYTAHMDSYNCCFELQNGKITLSEKKSV